MDTLIFDEKYLPGGSEPNRDMLIKEGTISLDGREDVESASFIENGGGFNCRLDGEHEYYFDNLFDMEMWRSGPSELSYRIMLVKPYLFTQTIPYELNASFETGESITIPLPISIVHDPAYNNTSSYPFLNEINIQADRASLPQMVDWDFGGLENIYVPGNKADPWRYQYRGWGEPVEPEDKCTNWGTTKDGSSLLRVYEDAISPQTSVELAEISPNGYGIRNSKAHGRFHMSSHPETKNAHTKVLYEGTEYDLPTDASIVIQLKGGQIEFARDSSSYVECTYKLEKNVNHSDPTGIDVHNEKLVLQLTSSDGANVATKDILVQIVDDAPFVKEAATMDLSGVAAWTLGGNKLPLSYDYLKDVLYRSTDYNDWATGFKVTKCEGKYGSIGVFADDGNPDDPASAPGNAYYMVDPAKIVSVAPDQVVTEAVEYTYTDSDGDTTSGVLNIVLKGTGLNPAEAISITPRPGNAPTSGGDVPADNPYVPGNPDDPDRDTTVYDPASEAYDPMNPNWGVAKDGQPLLRVFESGLPGGSEAGQRNAAAHGYLDINATVGLRSIIATTDGTDNYGFEGNMMVVPLAGGTLTFTQNPGENYLRYEFTLTDPVAHDPGGGINSGLQSVKLVATDNYGNEERISLEAQIIDDAPRLLVSDASHELGANAVAAAAGNIGDYIIEGADPAAANNWWADPDAILAAFAPYGALTLGEDGSYAFTLDTHSDAFRAIHAGETVNLSLPFQYQDLDGDAVQGTAQFNISGTEISLTPRVGNVPTSGGDVPADNPYVPGNPNDPDRDTTAYDPASEAYDPMNPNWGLAKDGQPLLRVFESGLPNGSEAGQKNVTAHGYLDIGATVGLQSIIATTDGTDSYGFENNMMTVPLDGGTLTFTQNPGEDYLKYEFTLTNPVMHDPGGGINSDEQYVKLIATDNFGNEERIGLEVQIIDDAPRPKYNDVDIIAWGSPVYVWGSGPRLGSISDKFFSADSIRGHDSYSIEPFAGKYGAFDVVESSYELNGITNYVTWFQYIVDLEKTASLMPDEILSEPFKYTYTDADGDSAEINAEIEIHGPGLKPHFAVNEADLANGCELSLPGLEIIEAYDSKYGAVSQDLDGVWRYRLSKAIDSGPVQGSNVTNIPDEIFMRVKDARGFEMIMNVDVDVIDSVPAFIAGPNSLAHSFGADIGSGLGFKVAVGGMERDLLPGVETMIAGRHGRLTLSADGSCHYAPNADAAGSDRFDFTIIDSDGDRALATIEASLVDGAPQLDISVQDADSLAEIHALGVSDAAGGFAGA